MATGAPDGLRRRWVDYYAPGDLPSLKNSWSGVKTFVVRDPKSEWHHLVNADEPVEAVQYALARTGHLLKTYLVIDHDLNGVSVDVTEKVEV